MRTCVGWTTVPAVLYFIAFLAGAAPFPVTCVAAPQASTPPLVVVDPGHGGKDPGAIGVTGDKEKVITLAVGHRVSDCLAQQKLKTVLTRSKDRFVAVDARVALANRLKANLLVSIHANTNPDHDVHGFTIYVGPHAVEQTLDMAQAVGHALKAAGFPSRGIRRHAYDVLVDSHGPAMLVELGFLSNGPENARLCNAKDQERYAEAISTGILAGLKQKQ